MAHPKTSRSYYDPTTHLAPWCWDYRCSNGSSLGTSNADWVIGAYHFESREASTNNPPHYGEGYPTGFRNHASYFRVSEMRHCRSLEEWKYRLSSIICKKAVAAPFSLDSSWKWGNVSTQPPDVATLAALKADIRNAALVKLKDRQMNLAESMGEWRQTYTMVRRTILDLVRMVNDIKRGRFSSALRRGKRSFSELWLEARYGWQPLLNDCFSIADALDQAWNGKYDQVWLYVKRCKTYDYEHSDPVFRNLTTYPIQVIKQDRRGFCKTLIKARYDYQIVTDRYLSLVDLGVRDPVLLAWELLPLSFVVDWFVGVADFLEGWTAQDGLRYLDGSISMRSESVEWASPWTYESGPYAADAQALGQSSVYVGSKVRRFYRWKELSAPTPTLLLRPDMIQKLMGFRLIDAIALLDQALTGRRGNYRR